MAITQTSFNKTLNIIKLSGLLVIPLVLLILPANFFDDGESICLSQVLAGIECYACGISRACMHLIHFEFQTAWEYNKLVVVIFPLLAFQWAKWFVIEAKAFKKNFMDKENEEVLKS